MTNAQAGKMKEAPSSKHHLVVPATIERMSRIQLLAWANETLKANFSGIEQLHVGDAYCLLNNVLFPGSIALSHVKWNAHRESDCTENWKLLSNDWKKRGVNKCIPIERLVKGTFGDNYAFLQWYKPFFEANFNGIPYDPVTMRAGVELPKGGKLGEAQKPASRSGGKSATPEVSLTQHKSGSTARQATPRLYAAGQQIAEDVDKQIGNLMATNMELKKECNFYYGKCVEVAELCRQKLTAGGDEFVCTLLKILTEGDNPVQVVSEPTSIVEMIETQLIVEVETQQSFAEGTGITGGMNEPLASVPVNAAVEESASAGGMNEPLASVPVHATAEEKRKHKDKHKKKNVRSADSKTPSSEKIVEKMGDLKM